MGLGHKAQQYPNKTKHSHFTVLRISVIAHNLKSVCPEIVGCGNVLKHSFPTLMKCNPLRMSTFKAATPNAAGEGKARVSAAFAE